MDIEPYDLPPPELVIEFDPPIVLNGGEWHKITLREPKGAEVRSAEGHLRKGVSQEAMRLYQMSLIEKVAGISSAVCGEIPASKLAMASEYLEAFVRPNRPTTNS